jgi:hypothetical protein
MLFLTYGLPESSTSLTSIPVASIVLFSHLSKPMLFVEGVIAPKYSLIEWLGVPKIVIDLVV